MNAPANKNINGQSQTQTNLDKLLLAVICLFLGWFGIHRFITGRFRTGVLQLVTFGAFGIWVLVDIYLIARGSFSGGIRDTTNMFSVLRFIRALCGFMFAFQIVTLLLSVPELNQLGGIPAALQEHYLIVLVLKVTTLALFGWLFFWLRQLINRLHEKTHGDPHPALANNKWAL